MIKILFCALVFMTITHSVLSAENASQILNQYNFTKKDTVYLLSKYPELKTLEIASEFNQQADSENFTLKLYSEYSNEVYIIQKDGEHIDIDKTFLEFEVSVKTIEGEIYDSLIETLIKDTGSEKIANQIATAFKDDFVRPAKRSRFNATYSFEVIEYFDSGRFVRYGDVLRASLVIGKAITTRVLKQDFETLAWQLLPDVPEIDERPFYAPVRSSRVSSLFQLNRRHPVTRRLQPHNGIDFVAPSGTPIFPALEGEIIAMGRARAKGKFILIQHDNGYQTTYDHLRKFSKGLSVGMRVALDDQIGEVGRTGYATGAHLHFGVIADDYYVDPINLVKEFTYDQKDNFENFEPAEEVSI